MAGLFLVCLVATAFAQAPPARWNLGQQDAGAAAGNAGNAETFDAVGSNKLAVTGTPFYSANELGNGAPGNVEGNFKGLLDNDVIANLSLHQPPSLTRITASSAKLYSGDPLTLNAQGVTGDAQGLTFVWRKDGTAIANSGATAFIAFPSVTVADSGGYDVVLANDFGAVTSAVIKVTILDWKSKTGLALGLANGQAVVALTNGNSNAVYRLQRTLGLNPPAWFNVDQRTTDPNGNALLQDPEPAFEKAFYRAVTVRVFVLAGQSNAAGHNDVSQYHSGLDPFPFDRRFQPGVLYWPGKDALLLNESIWSTLRVSSSGSFGPEISFAFDTQQTLPGEKIAIVKYAVDGTGIARSADYTDYIPALAGFDDKGRNWHPPTDGRPAGSLYTALIANVRGALNALERDGKSCELAGFLWMQGEHEAGISLKMAQDYPQLLTDFIASVRKDLGTPALPFAIGQVNRHTWAYGDIARKGQDEVCRTVPGALLVKTIDLPRNPDPAHFNADGMLTLGSRFAQAMEVLTFQTGK